jgi:transposase
MSVYVGIDVHRKRSQVAVVAEDGKVQLNKNTVNGTEPLLRLIGDLPAGTPVASGAAFGWGWLLRLLEGYGFEPHLVHPLQCKAIASARLKNDLLTELTDRSLGWCVRTLVILARFRPRDQRRGYAAGVVRAGGAAARLA